MQNPNNAHNANRNGKKERMMERKYNSWILIENPFIVRYTEIEKANRLLLEKMSNIMQKPSKLYEPTPQTFLGNKKSLNRD